MKSPMILALLIGLLFAVLHIRLPAALFQGIKMVGGASISIMLFALGMRMRNISFKNWPIGLMVAMICSLAGLIVAWDLDHVLHLNRQLFLFASLPPAVFGFMVAECYKQEPDKVASIVLLGNLAALSFVPLGLWMEMR